MLRAAGSPLVAGNVNISEGGTAMNMQCVREVRAFYYGGQALAPGTELEVPATFANELVTARKAELIAVESDGDEQRGGSDAQ